MQSCGGIYSLPTGWGHGCGPSDSSWCTMVVGDAFRVSRGHVPGPLTSPPFQSWRFVEQVARPILRSLYLDGSHGRARRKRQANTTRGASTSLFPARRACSITVAWHVRNGDVQPYKVCANVNVQRYSPCMPATSDVLYSCRTSPSTEAWLLRSQLLSPPPK